MTCICDTYDSHAADMPHFGSEFVIGLFMLGSQGFLYQVQFCVYALAAASMP